MELIKYLRVNYPGIINERYEVDESKELTDIILDIAKNRNCLLKGGEPDYSKAASLVIDDFRSGKMGNITLETPEQSNGHKEG